MSRPKFNTPEELQEQIDEYFNSVMEERITWTGLCLALDTNKQTLLNYQEKPEYNHIVTMAKLRVENAYELSLRKNGRSGDIFGLKNFGWSDKQEIEHSGKDGGPIEVDYRLKIAEKLKLNDHSE